VFDMEPRWPLFEMWLKLSPHRNHFSLQANVKVLIEH
jgi:hypothetical protein